MNSWERVNAIIAGKPADRPAVINPVSNITSETCRAIGIKFNEVHLNAEKMARLAAYPYENLGFDSIMPHFSVVQEVATLGAEIDWGGGDTGADAVTLADHITSDLVGVKTYTRFLQEVHAEINRQFPNRILILHCCGDTTDRVAHFAQGGFKIFHFESKNNLQQTIERAGSMLLTGGVNNLEVLLNGTPESVRNNVTRLLEVGIQLISPECAVPLGVHNQNLLELSKTLKRG